jgi:hypothetical protein
VANRTVRFDGGSDVILDDRVVLRFVLCFVLDRCRLLQSVEYPIDDDPPDDGNRQAGHDEQNSGNKWGHFYATSEREFGDQAGLVDLRTHIRDQDTTSSTGQSRRLCDWTNSWRARKTRAANIFQNRDEGVAEDVSFCGRCGL